MELSRRKRRAFDQSEEEEEEEEEESLEDVKRDWSILPELLLETILSRLKTLEDFFAFRGVCHTWRSAATPTHRSTSSQSPLILLARFPGDTQALYDIAHRRLYAASFPWRCDSRYTLGYSHGHLITSTRTSPWKPLLWNLFTGSIIRLPRTRKKFCRAILSSPPSSPDCVVVLFGDDLLGFQYCRLGDGRWLEFSWYQLGGSSLIYGYDVQDLIFVRGRLYSMSCKAVLGVVDLFPHPKLTILELNLCLGEELEHPSWLAELDGELLVVCTTIISDGFHVLRCDFDRGELVEVSDLGGWALFIGFDGFAGSVAADGFNVRYNSIYKIDTCHNEWSVASLVDNGWETVSPDSCGLLGAFTGKPPVWVLPSLC